MPRRLLTGSIDVSTLPVVAVGLLIAGTGGWKPEAWAVALPVMGLGGAARAGFSVGYRTYNPELREPPGIHDGPARDPETGRFVHRDHGGHG